MFDIFISAGIAILTILMAYLGVHVTLHPKTDSPREQFWYKAGFLICGVLAVVLVIVQARRSTKTQEKAASQVSDLQRDIQDAKAEAQGAKEEMRIESSRRQQAEKDLLIALEGSGKATRQGVAEDIRKSPLRVELIG
jgi:hypothetical protein